MKPLITESRLKRVAISGDLLLSMCIEGHMHSTYPALLKVAHGLPEGTALFGMQVNSHEDTVVLIVTHSSFPELSDEEIAADHIPYVTPTIARWKRTL